jgi:hypothetical protein
MREVVAGNGGGAAAPAAAESAPAPPPEAPAPEEEEAGPDPVRRIEESLGHRLGEVRRTRSGRVVAVVDRHDEETERIVREAAGEEVVVLDAAKLAALEAFGEDSPLAGAEVVSAPREAAAVEDRRKEELTRVARRRLAAARKLAEAGMGAEAIPLAHEAMLTRLRAALPADADAPDPAGLLRAVYERLLPEGTVTLDQAGAVGRVGDLARAYADRDAEVPAPIVSRVLEEAAALVEG